MMANNILTEQFSEPLNQVTAARINILAGDGNLSIDRLNSGEQVLASGALQYFEKQGVPTRSLVASNGKASLELRGGRAGQPWFHFPWSACNGATEWQIQLNPTVASDITAHSDGGNLKLNLTGMSVTCVSADTGGGNVDVILPDNAADLSVSANTGAGNVIIEIGSDVTGNNRINASSGAGNVDVYITSSITARIHATKGLGKAIIDPQFSMIGKDTYQSPDYDASANKVEITIKSGAGNVSVIVR